MHLDGSATTQVSSGPLDIFPTCTSDGKWLFYVDNQDPAKPLIMRMSVAGGAVQRVADGVYYALSSDGKLVAIVSPAEPSQLQLISTETHQLVTSFLRPPNSTSHLTFSTDNKSVYYPSWSATGETVWSQPLDALTPSKIATFPPGANISWMRQSPDGKNLGLIVRNPRSNAVLLRDTR